MENANDFSRDVRLYRSRDNWEQIIRGQWPFRGRRGRAGCGQRQQSLSTRRRPKTNSKGAVNLRIAEQTILFFTGMTRPVNRKFQPVISITSQKYGSS